MSLTALSSISGPIYKKFTELKLRSSEKEFLQKYNSTYDQLEEMGFENPDLIPFLSATFSNPLGLSEDIDVAESGANELIEDFNDAYDFLESIGYEDPQQRAFVSTGFGSNQEYIESYNQFYDFLEDFGLEDPIYSSTVLSTASSIPRIPDNMLKFWKGLGYCDGLSKIEEDY